MTGPTYFEHVAKAPELTVVEYKPAPDAEACALRLALVRVTDERDFWRSRAQALERDLHVATTAHRTNHTENSMREPA